MNEGESLDTATYLSTQASQVLANPIPYHHNRSVVSNRGVKATLVVCENLLIYPGPE